MKIIGFEGSGAQHYPITWGAGAARDDDGTIYNCASGFGRKYDGDDELESVSMLDVPFDLGAVEMPMDPMIVLSIRDKCVGEGMIYNERAIQYLPQKGWTAYLYKNSEDLRLDADAFAALLIDYVQSLLRTGLIMSAHNLKMNSLSTLIRCLAPDADLDHQKAMGQAILRDPKDVKLFKDIFHVE